MKFSKKIEKIELSQIFKKKLKKINFVKFYKKIEKNELCQIFQKNKKIELS